MKIRKQIRLLYFYEVVSGLQIVDLVWVLLMLQRGFSIEEAGIAEGVFHSVSMCCEIPSGMAADLIGRKRTLVTAGILSAVSALCMVSSDFFPVILLAMGLNALSYNLVSGTREALTYDSLKEAGLEAQYLKVSSRQESIYQILCAATGLISVATVSIGYRAAYLLAAVQGIVCACTAARLQEAARDTGRAGQKLKVRLLGREMIRHFGASFRFLGKNRFMRRRMVVCGGIGAAGYLTSMLLQEYLVDVGLQEYLVGIPLFFISVCGAAGAFLGEKTGNQKSRTVVLMGGLIGAAAAVICGSQSILTIIAAAAAVQCMDEMVCLRMENENQKETDSGIRATVISAGSMVYSIWMAVLSPVCGAAAKRFSVSSTFAGLGILMAAMAVWYSVGENASGEK